MSFVQAMNEEDLVTVPFLNHHPVFALEDPFSGSRGAKGTIRRTS